MSTISNGLSLPNDVTLATASPSNSNNGTPIPSGSPTNPTTTTATTAAAASKNYSRTPTSWDAQDDILLMQLKDQQKLGWKEIASHFTNRTPNACQFRWRRLKSGNLKNPPKSASAISTPTNNNTSLNTKLNDSSIPKKQKKSKFDSNNQINNNSNNGGGFPSAYSPISNTTFTGYDNNISNALAGLNALSNTPSNISSPIPMYNNQNHNQHSNSISSTNKSSPNNLQNTTSSSNIIHHKPQHINTTNHPQHFDNKSLHSEINLDPQAHNHIPPITGGGYYADISIDPTMNLPHNQPNPHNQSSNNQSNNNQNSRNSTSSTHNQHNHQNQNQQNNHQHNNNNQQTHMHNNSIIQIVKDDRNSISSTRLSVSSLPSKSMNIPHHQLNNNALAHLPILFGGTNGSISGPSRNSSISGVSSGIIHQSIVPSLRNGSIVSSSNNSNNIIGGGYYSRSGSVVLPYSERPNPDDLVSSSKIKLKKPSSSSISSKKHKISKSSKIKSKSKSKSKSNDHKNDNNKNNDKDSNSNSTNSTILIPWSMDEDELLINRRNRELSFAELSILLPQRTEGEIWSRIDYLEKLRNGHRSSNVRNGKKRRQSSIGLDDVDDFYDDVDDVIDGIGVSDDDDDDEDDEINNHNNHNNNDNHHDNNNNNIISHEHVVDDNDNDNAIEDDEEEEEEEEEDDEGEEEEEEEQEEDDDDDNDDNNELSNAFMKKRKRRASSVVNPLTVENSIRRRK